MPTLEEAVLAYAAAWNENDLTRRCELMERCWSDDGVILSNNEQLVGREAVLKRIDEWRSAHPGDYAVFASGIEEHHNWFLFQARAFHEDGTPYSDHDGFDLGEIGPDGRIVRIVTFHGPIPPIPEAWPRQLTILRPSPITPPQSS